MIARELPQDMGFELGTGWNGEVWVYKGMFWVYFSDDETLNNGHLQDRKVDGRTISRRDFFTKFIMAIETEEAERYTTYDFED